jgi:activating signal cointegrator 1
VKAISLHQPWATAIAFGFKTIETRSWSTKYRGPIAIHAALCWKAYQREFYRSVCEKLPWVGRALSGHVYLGHVVATANLAHCIATDQIKSVSLLDGLFGNFEPGRFAWVLTDIELLDPPVRALGHQGFFEVTLP